MIKNYKEMFGNIDTNSYIEAATKFLPNNGIKVLFIFESPPFEPPYHPITNEYNKNWSYFYNYNTTGSDYLRRILCSTLFDEKMINAKSFLEKFSNNGYFLTDAVSYPINNIINERKHLVKINKKDNKVHSDERTKIIYSESDELVKNINSWVQNSNSNLQNIKIIVVSATVFKGLLLQESKFMEMVKKGIYNVLNDFKIDFPLFYINTFKQVIRKLLFINF